MLATLYVHFKNMPGRPIRLPRIYSDVLAFHADHKAYYVTWQDGRPVGDEPTEWIAKADVRDIYLEEVA